MTDNLPPPPSGDGQRLAQLFHLAYDRLRTRIYGQARDAGFADLRPAHSSLLRNIDPAGSRVVDLAERAGMTKQSMARLSREAEAELAITLGETEMTRLHTTMRQLVAALR